MGVPAPNIRDKPDTMVRAIQYSLKEQAARELLTEAQWRGLDVKVQSEYDINRMALRLRIAWSDPNDRKFARCIEHLVDDDVAKDLNLLATEVNTVVKNISLRGELFFFRLAKHFPKHLKKVECDGSGQMNVHFKNGQHISAPEADVESREFLAKCGMIYDL